MDSATREGRRGILATDRSLVRFLGAVALTARLTAHLTFDVRGGPLAGRPLDGGVRALGAMHVYLSTHSTCADVSGTARPRVRLRMWKMSLYGTPSM